MTIYSVFDPEFTEYGKVLAGYDTNELIGAMNNVDMPADDNLPVPIQLIILKHRNGPIATMDMLFKKKTSTFLSIKKEGNNNGK